jgi:hypothetical protein
MLTSQRRDNAPPMIEAAAGGPEAELLVLVRRGEALRCNNSSNRDQRKKED